MSELKAALDEAISGQGRVTLLVGEPGIGKTRTTQEFAAIARQKGVQVLWGRCHEQEGAPPYWPWVQVIRRYIQEKTPEQLREDMGLYASCIAEVVPELLERLPGLESPPTIQPEQARFRLFDSLTAFLKSASWKQPLALIFDDIHWADRAALLLLEFISQELEDSRLLIVGAYRDVELSRQHPLTETLGQLARVHVFQRVLLQGLGKEDVGHLIEAAAGSRQPNGLVEAVYGQTEGNPFFIKEVISLLKQEDTLGRAYEGATIRLPEAVREVIDRRLNRLSARCNETLAIAAIVGKEFEFRQLSALIEDISDDQLVEVLEEALRVWIIEEAPDVVGRYQFTHSLVQHALIDELSAMRRARLHARVAYALEQLYGDNASEHATQLVSHFAQAEMVLGSDQLVSYSRIAGERALSIYAYDEALSHFQRALAAKKNQPTDAEKAAILFGLGRAQGATGYVQDAWASLEQAFEYYVGERDIPQAVAVAEYPLFYVPGLTEPTRLVSDALSMVSPDSHEAGRLLCRYGLLLNLERAEYESAQESLTRALIIARRERDTVLEIQSLTNGADVDFYHLRWREVLEKSLKAIELARLANDMNAEVWPLYLAASAQWALGDSREMSLHAAAMLDRAEHLRNRGFLANALIVNSGAAHMKGNWQTARDFSERALDVAPHWFWPLACRALLEYETGNFGQGEAYMEQLMEEIQRTSPGQTAEAAYAVLLPGIVSRITGLPTHFDTAEAAARTVLSSPSATPRITWDVRLGLALIAAHQGDVASAEEQYDMLEPTRGTMLLQTSVDRVLGLLAHTSGRLDLAVEHFQAARSLCEEAGYRPEFAWLCHDYADALVQHNNPGDGETVRSLLDEGLSISTELGMIPLTERLTALAELAHAMPSRAPAYPDGLTQREVEVLRLIAAGKSNREIGRELFISDRTVAQHVTSILNKTAAANRTEAAIYANRHGLVS